MHHPQGLVFKYASKPANQVTVDGQYVNFPLESQAESYLEGKSECLFFNPTGNQLFPFSYLPAQPVPERLKTVSISQLSEDGYSMHSVPKLNDTSHSEMQPEGFSKQDEWLSEAI